MKTPAPDAPAAPPAVMLTINGKHYVLTPFEFADLPRVAELGVAIIDRIAPIKSPEGLFGALRHCSAELLELAALSAKVPPAEFAGLSAGNGLELVMSMFKLNQTLLVHQLPTMIEAVCGFTTGVLAAAQSAAELNMLATMPASGGH